MATVSPRTRAYDHVESVARVLHEQFGSTVEYATVIAQVESAFAEYRDARVADFVPILVTRRAWENLRSMTTDDVGVPARPSVSPDLVDAIASPT